MLRCKILIQKTVNEYFPGKKKYITNALTGNFLDEISDFKRFYILFSAGYHSTTTALQFHDYGFKNCVLVHNQTFLEPKYTLDLIQKIIKITDFPYILVNPKHYGLNERVGDIFKQSLSKVDDIVEYFKLNRKDYRDIIPCCKKLKKGPSRKFYTKELNKDEDVVISSILPHESANRGINLAELRNKDTYLRFHKKMGGVWHAYPWRDMFSDRPFHDYLLTKGIMPEHSGCIKCPIQIAYDKWKNSKNGGK